MSAPAPTYVIGHRHPDADSICSALAYAAYKEATGEPGHVAARCGNSNARIDTILARFRTPLPVLLTDVSPRVRDVMVTDIHSVAESATCAEALELIDRHGHRFVPVLGSGGRLLGTVSTSQLAHAFLPQIADPKRMRIVTTCLDSIARTLRARVLLPGAHPDRVEELSLRIGAMDVATFWRLSQAEGIVPGRTIVVVGDRRDIQLKAVDLGIRLLVITGNHPVADAVAAAAEHRGVCLLGSPYDTATTALLIRTAGRLAPLIDRTPPTINAEARLAEARRRLGATQAPAFLVLDEELRLQGLLTKTDVLKPIPTRLVLVDHNELSQAVPGADEVTITEILDHHRLGPIATPQPILFLNEPVGSTCTIVADLFRRRGLRPAPDLAGLLMSGLISDTLLLQSPTTTPKDAEVLAWLEERAEIRAGALAELIFSSGSVILAQPPEHVVRADFKIYEEETVRFSVSQVEELGYDNFRAQAPALASALADLRATEHLAFACLLVTDIHTQNSLMLVKGEPDLIRAITYPHSVADEIFDLPGVVSRKKQLIPYLTGMLRGERALGGPTPARH